MDSPARWQVLVSGQLGRVAMPSPPMRAPAPDPQPSAIQAETPPPQHTPVPAGRWPLPTLDLSVSADALVLLGICGWLIWRHFLRQVVLSRFGFLLGSQQNARYLVELLAQVAVLTGASRVALVTLYNPELLTTGYGYTRVAILSCYVAPGRLPLDVESRSMPMERIRADVQDLLDHADGGWRLVEAGPHLPCRAAPTGLAAQLKASPADGQRGQWRHRHHGPRHGAADAPAGRHCGPAAQRPRADGARPDHGRHRRRSPESEPGQSPAAMEYIKPWIQLPERTTDRGITTA